MIPENEGKNEFAALRLMGWGRFLQNIAFDRFIFQTNLGCTVNRYSGFPTVLKKVLNKSVK